MEKSPTEHYGERYGHSPLPKQNHRWEPWARAVLSFICGVLSAAFLFGGKSRSLDELLVWKGEVKKQFENITDEFKRMDRDGTNRSHWVDDNQSGQIAANQSRLSELEKKAEQRSEQINVMQVKIEKLERELETAKNRNPK